MKSNLEMKPVPLEWEIDATKRAIVWHGPSNHDFGELLSGGKVQPRDRAMETVREALREGPIPSTRLDEILAANGVSEGTARRANSAAGVETWKARGVKDGPWMVGPPGSMKMLDDRHTKLSIFPSSPPEEAPAQSALILPEEGKGPLRREDVQDAHLYIPGGEHLHPESVGMITSDDDEWGSLDDEA